MHAVTRALANGVDDEVMDAFQKQTLACLAVQRMVQRSVKAAPDGAQVVARLSLCVRVSANHNAPVRFRLVATRRCTALRRRILGSLGDGR